MSIPTPGISPDGNLAFLYRAAHDDVFRHELEANPAAVLANHGIQVDAETLPERITLPSKQELQQAFQLADGSVLDTIIDLIFRPWASEFGPN
ncbi:MAG: hypothetical protein D6696_20045 [Acidobacteria bacterium]|nr:MAG: hypothetical protein D6696_20045 [Acidobacteriota bacterium]